MSGRGGPNLPGAMFGGGGGGGPMIGGRIPIGGLPPILGIGGVWKFRIPWGPDGPGGGICCGICVPGIRCGPQPFPIFWFRG